MRILPTIRYCYFEIEDKLQAALDIPVFHDDQHGTSVVVSAAVLNAAKLTGRDPKNIKVVMNGAGAAGTAIAKMLLDLGITDILMCDRSGIISSERKDLNYVKRDLAKITNEKNVSEMLENTVKSKKTTDRKSVV